MKKIPITIILLFFLCTPLYSSPILIPPNVDLTIKVGSYLFGYRSYPGNRGETEFLCLGPTAIKLTKTKKWILGTSFVVINSLLVYYILKRRKRKKTEQESEADFKPPSSDFNQLT